MTYPVQNQSAPQYEECMYGTEATSDYESDFMATDALSDDQFVVDEGMESGGETQVDLSPQGLRNRLKELNAMLQSSSLDPASRRSLEKEIQKLQGTVNFVESLSPQQRQAKLEEIAAQMGELESKICGLGEDDLAEMPDEVGDDFSQEDLESKSRNLESKIDDLFKDGAITEELRDDLLEQLGRIEKELNGSSPDLETAGELLNDFSEQLNGYKSEFFSTGEAADAAPVEGAATAAPLFDNLLSKIGGGMEEKELLEKIRAYYPNLDTDANGTLSKKELDKAILEKTWPGINGPDQTMLTFLSNADKEFKTYFDQASRDGWQSWKKSSKRLVSLLQAIYPDKADVIKVADWNGDARSWCNVWFDGVLFSFANKSVDGCTERTLCDNSKPANSLVFTSWNQTNEGAWYPQGANFDPNRASDMNDSLGAVIGGVWDDIF